MFSKLRLREGRNPEKSYVIPRQRGVAKGWRNSAVPLTCEILSVLVRLLTAVGEVDADVDRVRYRAAGYAVTGESKDDEVGVLLQQGVAKSLKEFIAALVAWLTCG